MRKLINIINKKIELKDFPIRVIAGVDHVIVKTQPSE
jgi:hypothetical protein